MGIVELPIDTTWAVGYVLALTRIGSFVVASPIIGRAVPATARVAFTVAVALAATQPVDGVVEVSDLVAAVAVNATVGGAMGYVTGVIIHLFASAGGVIDLVSGLAVSTVFDPLQGDQGGAFARIFHLAGATLFLTGGGLVLLVTGLAGSVRVLPLDAGLAPHPGLAGYVVSLAAQVVRSGVELALPVIGVLMMIELALGLAARFAPQANVFLLGLPAKLLAAITVVGSSWVLFPDVIRGVEATVTRSFEAVLRGFGASIA